MSKAAPQRGAKSEAVRQYLKANPDAGPTEVVNALSDLGVTIGLVSNIKTRLAQGKTERKVNRKARRRRERQVAAQAASFTAAELVQVQTFVADFGSVERVQQALEALALLGRQAA